ncbi:hypothetical protein ACH5RR_027423 [Cinchona calisaya]|uniref:RNase H type-1 domain-containing protein n=1 Tax=Cinchona calisaya TaxID=153742 RepID=A0ABD2Z796_9GENT
MLWHDLNLSNDLRVNCDDELNFWIRKGTTSSLKSSFFQYPLGDDFLFRCLLCKFQVVSIKHSFCEGNRCADFVANFVEYDSIPPELGKFLKDDVRRLAVPRVISVGCTS